MEIGSLCFVKEQKQNDLHNKHLFVNIIANKIVTIIIYRDNCN